MKLCPIQIWKWMWYQEYLEYRLEITLMHYAVIAYTVCVYKHSILYFTRTSIVMSWSCEIRGFFLFFNICILCIKLIKKVWTQADTDSVKTHLQCKHCFYATFITECRWNDDFFHNTLWPWCAEIFHITWLLPWWWNSFLS